MTEEHYKITIMSDAPEGEAYKKMDKLTDLITEVAEANGYHIWMTGSLVDGDGENQ